MNTRTTQYTAAHGHAPRGRGFWAFDVTCYSQAVRERVAWLAGRDALRPDTRTYVVFVPGAHTFTEAKRLVAAGLAGLPTHDFSVQVSS